MASKAIAGDQGSSSAETEVLEAEEQALEPHEYRFVNRWRLTGDVDSISDIIGDPEGYQHWWPSAWLDYKSIQPGDERGIGRAFRYRVKGWLPYTLNLTFRVIDVRTLTAIRSTQLATSWGRASGRSPRMAPGSRSPTSGGFEPSGRSSVDSLVC